MKTFIYNRINLHKFEKTGRPEDEIVIYRVKNNVPLKLAQIVRGYQTANQAVVNYLVANKHIKRSPEGKPYYFSDDLKKINVQIIEI